MQAYENCLESAKETYAEDSATLKENQLYSSLQHRRCRLAV